MSTTTNTSIGFNSGLELTLAKVDRNRLVEAILNGDQYFIQGPDAVIILKDVVFVVPTTDEP